jgi:hypothetical protein
VTVPQEHAGYAVAARQCLARQLHHRGEPKEYIEEKAKATTFKLQLTDHVAHGVGKGRVVALPVHRDTSFLVALTQNDIDGVSVAG